MAESLITYGSSKGRSSTDISLDDVKYLALLSHKLLSCLELAGRLSTIRLEPVIQ